MSKRRPPDGVDPGRGPGREGTDAADPTGDRGADESMDAVQVAAFERFVRGAIRDLVSDPRVRVDLEESMAEQPGDDLVDRLLRSQQVLARVTARERSRDASPSEGAPKIDPESQDAFLDGPLDAASFERLQRARRLGFETQLRVIYELSLHGGRSWPGLVAASSPPGDAVRRQDPVLLALRTLTGGGWQHRRASLRRAAERARHDALGFCRLVVEEADALGDETVPVGSGSAPEGESGARSGDEGGPPAVSPLAYVSILFDDPFLQRDAERAWFDLRSRCALYLGDRHRRAGRRAEFEAQLRALPDLLAMGTGDSDLHAALLELHAARALDMGERVEAKRHFLRASLLLSEFRPLDRRVEVLHKYALVLAADPATRPAAPKVLQTLMALLGPLADDVNPGLRLRLSHALARVELQLARQRVAAKDPLGLGLGVGSPAAPRAALDRYRDAWLQEGAARRRARRWLRAADPLYGPHGTAGLLAERRWLLGQSHLAEQPALAADHLRAALAAFAAAGDGRRAAATFVDLITSLVLRDRRGQDRDAGSATDDAGDDGPRWSAELWHELALHSHWMDVVDGGGTGDNPSDQTGDGHSATDKATESDRRRLEALLVRLREWLRQDLPEEPVN